MPQIAIRIVLGFVLIPFLTVTGDAYQNAPPTAVPTDADEWHAYGVRLMEQGQSQEAIAAFDRAIILKPSFAEAHKNRGNAFWDTGNLAAAQREYLQAIQVDQHYAPAWNNRGLIWEAAGEAKLALLNLEMALQVEPNYVISLSNRARILQATAQYSRAFDDLGRIVQLQTATFGNASLQVAFAHEAFAEALYNAPGEHQDCERAIEQLETAIKIREQHTEPMLAAIVADVRSIGQAYLTLNKLDEAIAQWSRAIRLTRTGQPVDRQSEATLLYQLGLIAVHAQKLDVAERHLREVEQLLDGLQQPFQPEWQVNACRELGKIADAQEDLDKAERWYRKALEKTEEHLGNLGDSPAILAGVLEQLADLMKKRGRYEEEITLRLRLLAVLKSQHGEFSREVQIAYGDLGTSRIGLKQFAEAANYMERALEAAEQSESKGSIDNVRHYRFQAGLCWTLAKQHERALEHFRHVLQIDTERNPPTKADYTLHWVIGRCHKSLKQYGDARQHYEQSLALAEAAKALDGVFQARKGLAEICRQQQQLEKAESHLHQAYKTFEATYGADHSKSLEVRKELADAIGERGQFLRQELVVREILAAQMKVSGPESKATAKAYESLALCLSRQEKNPESEEAYRSAWKLRRKIDGDQNSDTLRVRRNVAYVMGKQGKFNKQEAICREVLKGREEVLGIESEATATSAFDLALCLARQERHGEAEPYYQQAYDILREIHGESHAETIIAKSSIAICLQRQGDFEGAQTLLRSVIQLREETLGRKHSDTISSYQSLGYVLSELGELKEAESMYRHVLRYRRETLGENHVDTAKTLTSIGLCLGRQKQWSKAIDAYNRSLEIRIKVQGKDHQDVATAYANLGYAFHGHNLWEDALRSYETALNMRKQQPEADAVAITRSQIGMGLALKKLYRLDEARQIFEEAYKTRSQTLGEEHSDSIFALSKIADVYLDQGNYQKTRELCEKVVALRRIQAGRNSDDYAYALLELSSCLDELGENQRSIELCREALAIREQIFGEIHAKTATVISNLGLHLETAGDIEAALQHHRRALKIRLELKNRDEQDIAYSRNQVGRILTTLGTFDEAEAELKESLRLRRKLFGNEHPDVAWSLSSLGFLHQVRANFAEARSCHQQALEILTRTSGGDHPDVVSCLENLATISVTLKDNATAIQHQSKAISIRESFFGTSHLLTGYSYSAMAGIAIQAGRTADGINYAFKALKNYRAQKGDASLQIAHVEILLSSIYMDLGSYDLAESHASDALKTLQQFNDTADADHHNTYYAMRNLANAYKWNGNLDKAVDYGRECLTYARRKFGEDSLESVAMHQYLGYILLRKTRSYKAAQQAFRRYFDLGMRWQRQQVASLSDAEAMLFAENARFGRGSYLSLLRHLPGDVAEEAYRTVWEGRGYVTDIISRRMQTAQDTPEAKEVLSQLQAVRSQLSGRILNAPVESDKDLTKELNRRKEHLQRQLANLMAGAESQNQSVVSFADLGRSLPRDTAFVEIVETFDETLDPDGAIELKSKMVLDAFVLRKSESQSGYSLNWIKLGESKPINLAAAEWQKRLEGNQKPNRPEVSARTPEDILREELWNHIDPHLFGCTQIVIVPSVSLSRVPWSALPGRKPGTYLLEDYSIGTVYHGTQLYRALKEPRSFSGKTLLVGGVDYDAKHTKVDESHLVVQRGPKSTGSKRIHWTNLPGTVLEAESIAAGIQLDQEVVRLTGSSASESALRRELPRSRYVHLATHGFFASPEFQDAARLHGSKQSLFGEDASMWSYRATAATRNPLVLSSLVLAGVNAERPRNEIGLPVGDDGYLTAEEILSLDLRGVQLAVLSACETGLGDLAGAEGVFGLQRAFHLAGAETVVASLWKVDDQATAALMKVFYHKLWKENKPVATALREAQLTLLNHPELVSKLAEARGPIFSNVVKVADRKKTVVKDRSATVRSWAAFSYSGLPALSP